MKIIFSLITLIMICSAFPIDVTGFEEESTKKEEPKIYTTKNGYLCALYSDTLEKALDEYPMFKHNDPLSISINDGMDAIFRTRDGVQCKIIAEKKTKKGVIIVQTESVDISPMTRKTILIWTARDALK